jgi:hypothetical protein
LERRPNDAEIQEYAVLESDLDRLVNAIKGIITTSKQDRDWQTARAICNTKGVRGIRATSTVSILLNALRSDGQLSGIDRLAPYRTGGRVRIRSRVHFSFSELDRLLAGLDLAQVAKAFATISPGPGMATASIENTRTQTRRGPKLKPRTQAIYKLCFSLYVTDEWTAARTMEEVNRQYGDDTITEESTVRMYAGRYAKTNKLPKPIKPPTPRRGNVIAG